LAIVLREIGIARFVLGFAYLWAGQLDPAQKWLNDALKLTERTGDIVLQSRCLTYLTLIQRRRGAIEDTRRYAEHSLASATSAKMVEYIAMAKGNLAWVHLRNGDVASAFKEAAEAVEHFRHTPHVRAMPVLWVPLWPLIGAQLMQEQISDAIDHVEPLLTPSQMAIPADLESAMRAAVEAWKGNDRAAAKIHLEKAAELAREIGYL
jgi:tetratricopeptide (TPR) repeat protein